MIWTRRHYLVPLIAWIAAYVYAVGFRVIYFTLTQTEAPIWWISLTGFFAYWFAVWCARKMLFR
jgi:hypothetical protein